MTSEKRLRSGVYADVKNICKEVAGQVNLEYEAHAVDLIGELVWKKILLYAQDLEAFQKHAKRSTINVDDVKLLFRRNPSIKEFIENECPTNKPETSNAGKRKRKESKIILD